MTAPGLVWGLFGQSLFSADVMPMDKIFALLILFGWMIPWFRIKVIVHCFRSKVPFWQTILALCAIVLYFWPEMLLGLTNSGSH